VQRFGSKNVVITGASAGVGRAAARKFAEEGFNVGLIARGEEGLKAAAEDVRERHTKPLVLQCDVADPQAVEMAAQRVEDELGQIDVWVNNAMASVFSPIKEMKAEEFKRVTEVTYLGYVYGTQAALRRMLPRDRGTIVQVGSALAYRSIPLQSAYCAAKHAIAGFTESLRCELIHDKSRVHVTMVQMPALNTPQFAWVKSRLPNKAQPVPPIYEPELAAEAIYFASQHKRRQLWVGAPTVASIVMEKLVPGLLDRYLARHGYSSQQTNEPEDPKRLHNLWEPVDANGRGDFGAHGTFDARASSFSPEFTMSKFRPWLEKAAVIGAGVLAGWAATRALHSSDGVAGTRVSAS
jgi:short-subunit dehydrogenase